MLLPTVQTHLRLLSLRVFIEVLEPDNTISSKITPSVLNIGYRPVKLYTGYQIPGDILRYGAKYRTSNWMNIHVIAYINHMKLLKASLGS